MVVSKENDLLGKVAGFTSVASGSVTRPANTTQYATGDAIGTAATSVIELTGCGRQLGGSGVISNVLVVDDAAPATKADLELWLFASAPAGEVDNAAFTPTDAELLELVGVVDLGSSPYVGDGNCVYQALTQNLCYRCSDEDRSLYGTLVVRNTYTPVSGEVFTVSLGVLQD